MAARAIWKGVLRAGDLAVPFKLYAAAKDRDVRFHLLHDQDLARVEQRLVDPRSGEEVPAEERRKGVEVEPGRFVLIGDDELEALEPEPSRDVAIERFLPRGALGRRWYERPYWLGPDGDDEPFAALAEALERREVEGIARWVMRKRDYAGALRGEDGRLALVALRHADEVVPTDALSPPAGRAAEQKELAMAEQLVRALAGEFDAGDYADEHRARVLALIEAKRRGREPELELLEPPAPRRESLSELLEQSLVGAGARGGGRRKRG
jgi:DNA end-binding protein Ku